MKDANLTSTSCKLWVVVEDKANPWWQKLNFNSAFLLSEINRYHKTAQPVEFTQLIQEVKWPMHSHQTQKPWTLIGCKNHFDADWLFLIHDLKEFKSKDLENLVEQLGIKNIRCFSPFEPSTSLKARLEHCDLVSDSKK
jgi:hypothetical protein